MSEALTETPAALPPTLLETKTETPPVTDPPAAETPATETKPEEAKTEAVPEFKFEALKLPEGLSVPDEAKSAFSEIVTKNKIPTEVAQSMMDLYAQQAQTAAAAQAKVWQDMNTAWQAEVKADKDIGGDKLPATLQRIAKVFDDPTLGVPGIREAMNLTGAGNNPAIVKLLANLAKVATEGGHIAGSPSGAVEPPADLGGALYGPNGPKQGR